MTLQIVSAELSAMAERSASNARIARTTRQYRQSERHAAAADKLLALQALVSASIVELDAYRTAVTTKPAKAKRAAPVTAMDALQFWSQRSEAVAAINLIYGAQWSISAPTGETLLVSLPAKYRAYTTERGTKLRWNKDQRIPAARFWPKGELPAGLEITPDYARHPMERANEFTTRMVPAQITHSDAWHIEHGYVLASFERGAGYKPGPDGSQVETYTTITDWIAELEVRAHPNRYTPVAAQLADAAD